MVAFRIGKLSLKIPNFQGENGSLSFRTMFRSIPKASPDECEYSL